MNKKLNKHLKVDLLEKIATQNGLTVEYGGDMMDGYIAKFCTPYKHSDGEVSSRRVVSMDIDMDNDDDILGDLPKIYRAAKQLMEDRCDYITNKEKEFFKKEETN